MKFTKETLKKTLRTFLQAMVAYILVGIPTLDYTADLPTLKSAAIGIGISAVAAGLAAVMNLEQTDNEQLGSGTMTFAAFVKAYLGKKTDWDGVYGVQCVDLIDVYITECLGLTKGFSGNAKTWWTNRNSSTWLKNNFEFITPTYKNGELQAGDIGIRTSGTYGHIFIVKEPTASGKIKYYDQNGDGNGAAMTLRTKTYSSSYINGVLRPKNQSVLGTTSTTSSSSTPTYNAGSQYKLTTDLKVRTGAGTSYSQKKKSQLTTDGQKNALNQTMAVLKSGTVVTAKKVVKNGSDIWLQIPSGYIAVYYNGNKYANWYKN